MPPLGNITWAIVADISTVGASLAVIFTLIFIAKQARRLREQLIVFREQSRTNLTYQMLLRWNDPQFSRHVQDATLVISDTSQSIDQKMRRFENPEDSFRFNLMVLMTFMETLSGAYFKGDIDQHLVYTLFWGLVTYYFTEVQRSGFLDHVRQKYGPGTLKLWENLASDFEKRGAPH